MSKIKILPEILSNKIAAGEIVERPASVVKELVENALDANSTKIIIELDKGGKSLIRVSDNGNGMNHDDALLSIERFATSKIFKDKDLFSINTLGFRGEALPSIASVSRFSIVTRDKTSENGTHLAIEGGKIIKVAAIGAPRGTMITVKQLFYNTPARRKFLKTINTEMGHIIDTIAGIALSWPDVQFRLHHNEKVLRNWLCSPDPLERVADVIGKDIRSELCKIGFDDNAISVSGWISSPRIKRSTSRGIYVFVNGRFIRDRVIQHALFEGYSQRLIKGQFPVAVIFITVPFDQVDVNVHPTKHEVRFAEQKKVYNAVARAASDALHLTGRSGWTPKKTPEQPDISETVAQYSVYPRPVTRTSQPASPNSHPASRIPHPTTRNSQPATRNSQPIQQSPLWEKKLFSDLRIIGQLKNTYIICESDEGLILIDQHAAHERIVFEQIKQISRAVKKPAQRLLIPETIDLGYKEAEILEQIIPELNAFGIEIEPFGGNTFVVKSIPTLLGDREIKPLIFEIIEKMVEIGFTPGLEEAIDQCLVLMACHGAIRANQHLSDEQISLLLEQLDKCGNPSHCPHGRPTWIKWTTRFFEKAFKRSP